MVNAKTQFRTDHAEQKIEFSHLRYFSLLWWVFFDNHIDKLLSVLGHQLEALLVDRSGQTVAEHIQGLLDLCLVGLVLQYGYHLLSYLVLVLHLDAGVKAGDDNFTESAVGASNFWSSNLNALDLLEISMSERVNAISHRSPPAELGIAQNPHCKVPSLSRSSLE